VELDNPQPGHAASFAAHITLLDDFKPVTAGEFRVEARSGSETATSHAAAPARPGIFTPSITFPTAGPFALVLTYTGPGGLTDSIEWTVEVHEHGEVPEPEEEDAGAISFLKEQQWKIPFATETATEREMKRSVWAIGQVLPSPTAHVEITAPIDGIVQVTDAGERQRRAAQASRARRINEADRDEREQHERRDDERRRDRLEIEEQQIDRDDVPVGGEPPESLVGLRVAVRELEGRGHADRRRPRQADRGRQESRDDPRGHERVIQIVDQVVE